MKGQQQQVMLDLDQRWSGVDEREHPAVVPGSSEVVNGATVRAAVNARFTGQYIETRPGYRRDLHYNKPVGNAWKHVGAGQYVDPVTRRQYVLTAKRVNLYEYSTLLYHEVLVCSAQTRPLLMQWTELKTAAGGYVQSYREQDMVRFTQLGADVVMWRRGRLPLLWTGVREVLTEITAEVPAVVVGCDDVTGTISEFTVTLASEVDGLGIQVGMLASDGGAGNVHASAVVVSVSGVTVTLTHANGATFTGSVTFTEPAVPTNGVPVADVRGGVFRPLEEVLPNIDTPGNYEPLPAADFGVVAAERLVFPYEGGIGWTDIGEARRWGRTGDAAGNLPRMDIGDDGGRVTGLLWWRGSVLLVFKERSVWAVEGWTGGLTSLAVKPITRAAGCIAPDSVAEVGGDVFWLGRGGVYSIGRALDTDTRIKEVPVSAPIPKTMARVNWTRAHLSSAVHVRGHYTLAVPLDGAQSPDTLMHFCTERPGWQGTDSININNQGNTAIVTLVPCLLGGGQTWSAVRQQDVITQGWSPADKAWNAIEAGSIALSVTFREFHAQDHSLTRWLRMEALTEESGTTGVTFTAQLPARMGTLPLQDATTRNRTQWKSSMRVARDMSNGDDDFLAAGREDYAFRLETGGIEIQSGITTCAVQEHTLAGNVVGTARGLAPAITTTGGLLRVAVIRGAGI